MQRNIRPLRVTPRAPVKIRLTAAVAVGLVVAAGWVEPAAAATTYTVEALPPVNGRVFDPNRGGNPVNDSGQVAGQLEINGEPRAVLYDTRTKTFRELDPSGDARAVASDVNRRSKVVGYKYADGSSTIQAFVWSPRHPVLRSLEPKAPSGSNIFATAINDHGVVVGSAEFPGDGHARVRVWRLRHGKARVIDLGARLGLPFSWAGGVSARGAVLVNYVEGPGIQALVWTPGGRVQKIDPLPGDDSVNGLGMSPTGVVVGYSVSTDDLPHERPFRWDPGTGTTTPLAVLEGNKITSAWAIGSTGVAVGDVSDFESNTSYAVAWNAAGTAVSVLPGQESTTSDSGRAVGIDGHGRIIGRTADQALWWTPRPRT